MGLPALAALTFLITVLWRERRRPTSIATWSGLIGLALDGMAQDIEHFRHVWVMIGLADAERRPANDAVGLIQPTRLIDDAHRGPGELRQVLQRDERRDTPPLAGGQRATSAAHRQPEIGGGPRRGEHSAGGAALTTSAGPMVHAARRAA